MDNISLELMVHWPSEEIGSRSKLRFMKNLQNCITVISCKNHAKQQTLCKVSHGADSILAWCVVVLHGLGYFG